MGGITVQDGIHKIPPIPWAIKFGNIMVAKENVTSMWLLQKYR